MSEPDDGTTARPKKTGCGAVAFIAGAGAITGGVMLMNRWAELGGVARAGAVMLVVVGTLLTLPVLLVAALKLVILLFMRRALKGFAGAGQEMLNGARAMYERVHEFRPATEEDFADVDRRYYEETAANLATYGFRHLGDVVDRTIEEMNGIRPPIRIFASDDGATGVALYHMPDLTGTETDKLLMCDVATEFTDGTFLVTSNTEGRDQMTPPPRMTKRQFPLHTPVPELLREHAAQLEKLLTEKASDGRSAVRITTLAEALDSERRQQEAKNEHRKEIGYLDPEEVRRIAKSGAALNDNDEESTDAFADMAARAADEARKNQRDNRDE